VEVNADFPAAFQILFEPRRYKILYGGRGGGRSWACARALLLKGIQSPIRVLCARELQNSISDSVHRLLSDQISGLGLDQYYEVQNARILGQNGTQFSFEGIKNNVTKIKSYEGIDYCWVEEAHKVSRNSWSILIPTVRKEGSEIWMTFNPELETDYTYNRFVKEADASQMLVIKTTWRDNPFFPQVLMQEMETEKQRDYDSYLNIWEGFCRQVLEGAVYAKELRKAQEEDRITKVPWVREAPVDVFFDLGRADATAVWFAQRIAMQYRIIDFYSATGEDIIHYIKWLQNREYIYGTVWLPHDAYAKQLGTQRSIYELIKHHGFKCQKVPKLSLVDGINAARLIFPNCWFDEDKCEEGIQALRHYRYRVIDNQYSNEPLHDWASDAADAFRYLAVAFRERKESVAASVLEKLTAIATQAMARKQDEMSEAWEMGGRESRGRGTSWMR
jgi:phage terminase large subunit